MNKKLNERDPSDSKKVKLKSHYVWLAGTSWWVNAFVFTSLWAALVFLHGWMCRCRWHANDGKKLITSYAACGKTMTKLTSLSIRGGTCRAIVIGEFSPRSRLSGSDYHSITQITPHHVTLWVTISYLPRDDELLLMELFTISLSYPLRWCLWYRNHDVDKLRVKAIRWVRRVLMNHKSFPMKAQIEKSRKTIDL